MTQSKPNILIILTDQQSHGMMSCAGTSWVNTPHLDRLAEGGMRFTKAYCANPVCVASRFSMFTGRMPSAIGMRGNGGQGFHPFDERHDLRNLGHLLRCGGYQTWYGGKEHWPIKLNPERMGFQGFCKDEREILAVESASLIHRLAGSHQPWAMVSSFINPHDICMHALRTFARPDDGTWDYRVIEILKTELSNLDEALRPPTNADPDDWIEAHCPPLPPNWNPQQEEPSMIEEVLKKRPFKLRARQQWTSNDWRLFRWAYARLTERVDRQIGVVLDALEASGQADNTLVIFTSDHGDHAGSHKLEHKTFFYEEAARVPWIMRLPGRIPAGTKNNTHLVNTGLDLMATCCDYTGVSIPSHNLGESCRPICEGAPSARTHLYAENRVGHMIVTHEFKYVLYDGGTHHEQLYDLMHDPGELRNAIHDASLTTVIEDLRQRLQREKARHTALALGPISENQESE